jgi:hypothetical protein
MGQFMSQQSQCLWAAFVLVARAKGNLIATAQPFCPKRLGHPCAFGTAIDAYIARIDANDWPQKAARRIA